MTVSTSNNAVTKEDTTVPGVVLAVSPDGSTLLINDQNRQVFYLYSNGNASTGTSTGTGTSTSGTSTATAGGIVTTFGGIGQRAQFSSDGQTVYIVGNNTMYIHNVFTGWSTEPLAAGVGANSNVQPATSITMPAMQRSQVPT